MNIPVEIIAAVIAVVSGVIGYLIRNNKSGVDKSINTLSSKLDSMQTILTNISAHIAKQEEKNEYNKEQFGYLWDKVKDLETEIEKLKTVASSLQNKYYKARELEEGIEKLTKEVNILKNKFSEKPTTGG